MASLVLPPLASREDVLARVNAHPVEGTPEARRASFRRLVLGDGPPTAGLPRDVAAVAKDGGWRLRPAGGRGGPPVIWFHGGGYVFGAPDTHLRPASWLAARSGREVWLPRYRLAPEHRWPAQLEDALAACARHPGAALAGDSAGGHLALVAALALARRGTPAAALLLFSPNTDRTGLNVGRAVMEEVDPMVDDADDRALARMCFGDLPDDHPHVSPLLDDLSLLPPTYVEVGLPELLHDDSALLAERGRAAGAQVTLHAAPGLPHLGQLWAPWWDEALRSLERAADALGEMLGRRAA